MRNNRFYKFDLNYILKPNKLRKIKFYEYYAVLKRCFPFDKFYRCKLMIKLMYYFLIQCKFEFFLNNLLFKFLEIELNKCFEIDYSEEDSSSFSVVKSKVLNDIF